MNGRKDIKCLGGSEMEELGSTLFPQLNRAAVQEMEVTNALTASFLTGIQNSKVGVSGTMCWTLGTQR